MTALTGVSLSVDAGERIAVLGPNGAGKTTLFRVLLGDLRPAAGTVRRAGRCAGVPQTERSRLDFPVSALDVALMGRDRPPVLVAAPRPREAGAGARGARRGRPRPPPRSHVRRGLRRPAPARADRPRPGRRRPPARPRRALQRPRPRQRAGARRPDRPARRRGSRPADRHPRHRPGPPLGRVLCLNRRQVALGPPGGTLTAPVLHATYGTELVELADGTQAALVPRGAHG